MNQEVLSGTQAITMERFANLAAFPVARDFDRYSVYELSMIADAYSSFALFLMDRNMSYEDARAEGEARLPDGVQVEFSHDRQHAAAQAGAMWAAVYDLIQMCQERGRDVYTMPLEAAPQTVRPATPNPFAPEPPTVPTPAGGPRLFAGQPIARGGNFAVEVAADGRDLRGNATPLTPHEQTMAERMTAQQWGMPVQIEQTLRDLRRVVDPDGEDER